MNLPGFVYNLLSGQLANDRRLAREQREFMDATAGQRRRMMREIQERAETAQMYASAQPTPNRKPPSQLHTPEDYRPAFERIVLIRAARQIREDQGFFDGLVSDFGTYVIGPNLRYQPSTGNDEADAVIWDWLQFRFDECDFTRREDLTGLAQLAWEGVKVDGESGAVLIDEPDAPLRIKLISGDCIGNPMIGQVAEAHNFNGIRIDPVTGAPILYDVFKRGEKVNSYTLDREVPANAFLHLYQPYMIQQYHGISEFKSAIRDAFDIDQILEFAKQNIKFRASQLPILHTETGRARGKGVWSPGGYGGEGEGGGVPSAPSAGPRPLTIDVDGVTTTVLKTDEDVVDFPHDFPNAQMQVSIDEFRRQCCRGVKIPFEFAYRSDSGGVVQRFHVNRAQNTFKRDKFRVQRQLLNPFKNRTLKRDVQSGALDLSRFGNLAKSRALYAGSWQMGEEILVDYGRENDTDIKLIEAGLMSPQEKASSMNIDLQQVRSEIYENAKWMLGNAQKLADELKMDVALVIPFLLKKFPNPGAGLQAAQADDDPETGQPVDDGK